MAKHFYRIFIGVLIVGMFGCTKHNNPATAPLQTVLQYIQGDSSLSLYNLALQRSGLLTDSAFNNGGPYTFFVPQNTAFIEAGFTQSVVNSMDTSRLKGILQFGIIQGRISAQDLSGFYTEPVTSLNPVYEPLLTKNYFGTFLNGVPSIQTDNNLGDGIIQETNRMILPPTGTLMQEIDTMPELSFLAAALHKNAFLRGALQLDSPATYNYNTQTYLYGITLLAPTNGAFQAFGYADTVAVQQADSATMMTLLQAFFFQGVLYSGDFKGGFVFNGGNGYPGVFPYNSIFYSGLYYLLTDGITFVSSATLSHVPQIIKPDVAGTNGVLHEINYMVLPGQN